MAPCLPFARLRIAPQIVRRMFSVSLQRGASSGREGAAPSPRRLHDAVLRRSVRAAARRRKNAGGARRAALMPGMARGERGERMPASPFMPCYSPSAIRLCAALRRVRYFHDIEPFSRCLLDLSQLSLASRPCCRRHARYFVFEPRLCMPALSARDALHLAYDASYVLQMPPRVAEDRDYARSAATP